MAGLLGLCLVFAGQPTGQGQVPVVRDPAGPPPPGVPAPRDAEATRVPATPQSYPLQLTAERAEAFVEAAARGLDYLPGEVIIRFKDGMSPAAQQRALMALRSRPDVSELRWMGEFAVLTDRSQPDARILAEQLSEQPEVLYAEPNFIATMPREPVEASAPLAVGGTNLVPNDPSYASLQWHFPAIDLPRAWDIQSGGKPDLIVGIVDTGVTSSQGAMSFPLFTGTSIQTVSMPYDRSPDLDSARILPGADFAFLSGGPVVDMDGHGTHVAHTVAQNTNNAFSLAGIAFNVKILPVKVCTGYWEVMIARAQSGITGFAPTDSGGCAFSAIAAGVRYAADNGAKVINISLGGTSQSQTLLDALNYAVSRGVFIAVSMGNSFETGNETRYPARYAADIQGMMNVASVGRSIKKAYYSSTGTYTEIAAPGGDSRDAGSAGLVWQVTLSTTGVSTSLLVPRFDVYAERGFQGTSMAAPHVAGSAALVISQIAGITPAQVESLLSSTARDLGAPGKDNEFGNGLVQPRTALFGSGIRK